MAGMKTRLLAAAVVSAALVVSGSGCSTNEMDRDLKRQADRAVLERNKLESEQAAMKTEVEQLRTALGAEKQRSESATRDVVDLRARLLRSEADLISARQRVRDLEEAALAARQGMPTTRSVQP
jgi:uncharacterized protein YaaN involved in tellurite resistance